MKKLSLTLFVLVFLISCSAAPSNTAPEMEKPTSERGDFDGYVVNEESMPDMIPIPEPETPAIVDPEKLVKTGRFRLETRQFDQDYQTLLTLIEGVGGFVESSTIDGTPNYYNPDSTRTLTQRLRIPKDKFDSFITSLKDKLLVITEETSSQSVADTYFDSENRIKVLEVQQTRLLTLMEEAENLSDIVLLQQQLMDVEYELNQHKGTLAKLDDEINYSTISLTMTELASDESSPVETNFFSDLSRAFGRGINSMVTLGQNLVLGIAENFIPIILLVGLGFGLFKFANRKPKTKSEKIEPPKSE